MNRCPAPHSAAALRAWKRGLAEDALDDLESGQLHVGAPEQIDELRARAADLGAKPRTERAADRVRRLRWR